MEKRSESEILSKTLTLTFAGKPYEVPVLRMTEAAKWRKYYFERTQQVADAMPMNVSESTPELSKMIGHSLMSALLNFPEAIPELVFSYAKDLPKDEIMAAEPYDQEFITAFQKVWGVAFQPFLASLGMVMEMHRSQAASNSPSSERSN